MANENESADRWFAATAKATALLCLHAEGLRQEPLVDQWFFLERLGLSRDEAAELLGTTSESLRVSASKRKSTARKSKGTKS